MATLLSSRILFAGSHPHTSPSHATSDTISTSLFSSHGFPSTLLSSIQVKKRICKAASEENPTQPAARQTLKIPKKPEYSLSKGQIVRVDKEKYLNSINYLSVGHPPYYKGLDYIYEDRGEVLDLRIFETGEYALIAWAGISTSPAWLPTSMLIKSEKLSYTRM